MDTDIFFDEYYDKVRKLKPEKESKLRLSLLDKVLLGLVIAFFIAYVVFLILKWVKPAIAVALITLIIVIVLTIKTSTGKAKEEAIKNRKKFQHSRYIAIKDLLSFYKLGSSDIDQLIERLDDNKEKYRYGHVLGLAIKTGFGIISAVLSGVSFTVFLEEGIKKAVEELSKEEIITPILEFLRDNWGLLTFDIVMTIVVIVELCFIWLAMIKPFLLRKYYYHDEIISDLKAHKLFERYHKSIDGDNEFSTISDIKAETTEDEKGKTDKKPEHTNSNAVNKNQNPSKRRDRRRNRH